MKIQKQPSLDHPIHPHTQSFTARPPGHPGRPHTASRPRRPGQVSDFDTNDDPSLDNYDDDQERFVNRPDGNDNQDSQQDNRGDSKGDRLQNRANTVKKEEKNNAVKDTMAVKQASTKTAGAAGADFDRLRGELIARKIEKKLPFEKPKPASRNVVAALRNSQQPGVFWRNHAPDDGEIDPELLAAIEELKSLLANVAGITRISPGFNDDQTSIIVVAVGKKFTRKSMRAIPAKSRGFTIVVSLPFDMLPLKRTT